MRPLQYRKPFQAGWIDSPLEGLLKKSHRGSALKITPPLRVVADTRERKITPPLRGSR